MVDTQVRHAEIIFGLSGQSFTFDPPEPYRPSGTPTVAVRYADGDDTSTTLTATTGSASVDSVNTTLSAAVYAGSSMLTLTSGTSVVRGRRYLLTDSDGDCEQVEIIAINGTAARTRQPLVNDYASGSTFQGTRISISVLDAWAATASNITDGLGDPDDIRVLTGSQSAGAAGYRLRWSYTVNGEATIGVSYADLVRYQSKNLVGPLDVDRIFPGWIDRLPPDYRSDQGRAFIEEAFQAVRMDAMTDSQLVRRIRDTQVLSELVRYRANLLSVQNNVMNNNVDGSALVIARDLYDQRYVSLIREPKIPVDQSGGGANGEAVRLPAFVR